MENGSGSPGPDDLLARLDAWLGSDPERAASGGGSAAVLRGPWDHLEHAAAGLENVRRTELLRLQNAASAEDRVRSDYRGRYAIELLQNAHDACADADIIGQAWLQLTDTALLVANQGAPFSAERIEALLQLGDSSKAADHVRHRTIGYKGIGFSAVLEITDRPQIVSQAVAFAFDRDAARTRVAAVLGLEPRAVPMRYFPFPLEPGELGSDRQAVDELLDAGAVTVIRLPLSNPRKGRDVADELEHGLRSETLLFMPHLRRMTVSVHGQTSGWSRRAGQPVGPGRVQHLRQHDGRTESWLVAQKTVQLHREVVDELEDPLWATVRSANVTVGIPWRDGRPDAGRGAQPLHVYFPTDDRLGRSLLVHGDFYVQSNRRRVTANGRGADVSRLIAEAAAELTADLAMNLAPHGNDLLRVLAPAAQADGFGLVLASMIDDRLRSRAFLRSATDGPPLLPAMCKRVNAPLLPRHVTALVGLLDRRADVLHPGDDAHCHEWLDALGTAPLLPSEVVRRLAPCPDTSYDAALSVLAHWYATLRGHEVLAVAGALQQRPLLQDDAGRWSAPGHLIQLDQRTPPLPAPLTRPVYKPPRSRDAREFAASALPVAVLTPDRALKAVLDHAAAQPRGSECPGVLDFLHSLWRADPALLKSVSNTNPGRVGVVPVPARALGRRDATAFAPAATVYFDKHWTDSDLLERMYGHFRRTEFLAADVPESRAERAALRQFWRVLGVSDTPRLIPVRSVHTQLSKTWRALKEVRQAATCPDGHPSSGRDYSGQVVDRLDELLDRGEERALRALAHYLCADPKPFGDPVVIVCQNSLHRGQRGRKALGYQNWLLTTQAWLPTDGGPAGRELRLPQDAWTDVPRGAARAVLPSPTVNVTKPAALGLNSVHRPSLERLEAAIRGVRATHPDLASAPADVRDGAAWLLRKVDAVAVRLPADSPSRDAMPMPAVQDGAPAWSTQPMIADLPGIEDVPKVAWLPAAPWTGLQRVYRLERSSSAVTATVTSSAAREVLPLLARHDRVQLLALLIGRGGEPGSLAFRLGNLTDRRVATLEVTYSIHGREWTDVPAFHLEQQRDAHNRVRSAELRTVMDLGGADLVQLGQLLAQHLGVGENGDLVGQYLFLRDVLVAAHRLLPSQLTEAEQLLRRYRAGASASDQDAGAGSRLHQDGEPVQGRSGNSPSTDGDRAAGTGAPTETAGNQADGPDGGRADESTKAAASAQFVAGAAQQPADVDRPPTRPAADETPANIAPAATATPARDQQGEQPEQLRPRRRGVVFGQSDRLVGQDRTARRPQGPRLRQVRGDQPGVGATGSPVAPSGADRRVTEKNAEDVAVRFLESRFRASVERVGSQNLGWDLTATLPDGNSLLVEVKGFAGSAADFVITRGELRASRENAARYRVCVVTNASGSTGRLAWFDGIGDLLREDHLDPYQWIVVDWPRCQHESVPWSEA